MLRHTIFLTKEMINLCNYIILWYFKNFLIDLFIFFLSFPNFIRQWHPTPVLSPGKSHGQRSLVGHSPWGREESDTTEWLTFSFHFHVLEKEMAIHSSTIAWKIPWTEEPGRPQSTGSQRVGHDWATFLPSVPINYTSTEMFLIKILCNYKKNAIKAI